MLSDYHLHTTFSKDSPTDPVTTVETAIANGFTEIAITDHMDFCHPNAQNIDHIDDMDLYVETISHLQKEYASQITIRFGVEVGLSRPKLDDCRQFVRSYPFDFVLASLHQMEGVELHTPSYFYCYPNKEAAYRRYYEEFSYMLDHYSDFDVFGHMDYIRRYMPFPYEESDHFLAKDTLIALLKKIIAKGKGIEINTSGFRHSASQMCLPHLETVALYHSLGGRRLTIGSDGHHKEHMGYNIPYVFQTLKQMGISTISTFSQRKETFVEI